MLALQWALAEVPGTGLGEGSDFVFSWGRMVNLEHRFCDEW